MIPRTGPSPSIDRESPINLGSIGKGYAIDRAVELIRRHWLPTSALVHGGQSSLFALGSPPGRFGGRWEIAVRNPFCPETPLGVLRLRNRGLGTSGSAFQQFVADGRVYGHILDPRTGEPAAGGPASVTVLAPTAADADALSTAFYLLGPEAARDYVAGNPEVGVVMVFRRPGRPVAPGLDAGVWPRGFPDRRQRVRLNDISVKNLRARVLAGDRGDHAAFAHLSDSPGTTTMPSTFIPPGILSYVIIPGFLAALFLVLLRIAIGWHFLTEGLEKVDSTRYGKQPFSAEIYLRNSVGPLAPQFRGMLPDADGAALLDPAKLKAELGDDRRSSRQPLQVRRRPEGQGEGPAGPGRLVGRRLVQRVRQPGEAREVPQRADARSKQTERNPGRTVVRARACLGSRGGPGGRPQNADRAAGRTDAAAD